MSRAGEGSGGAETKQHDPNPFIALKGREETSQSRFFLAPQRAAPRRLQRPDEKLVNGVGTVPAGADFCLSMISPRYPRPPLPPATPPFQQREQKGLHSGDGGGAEMLLCGPRRPAEFGSARERRVQTVTGMSHTHTCQRLTHTCVHTQTRMHKDSHMHVCTCTDTHAQTHTCMCARTQTHAQRLTHTRVRMHRHTHRLTHTCVHMHTDTGAHTCTK